MATMPNQQPYRYAALLLMQTLCAATIVYHIQSGFRVLADSIGIQGSVSPGGLIQLSLATVIGQACYWIRQHWVAVPSCRRSVVLGHLLTFTSRIGFVFGGALFSLYFLRHMPALDLGAADLIWRGILVLAVLFALYCYTLELERLGNALQKRTDAPDAG